MMIQRVLKMKARNIHYCLILTTVYVLSLVLFSLRAKDCSSFLSSMLFPGRERFLNVRNSVNASVSFLHLNHYLKDLLFDTHWRKKASRQLGCSFGTTIYMVQQWKTEATFSKPQALSNYQVLLPCLATLLEERLLFPKVVALKLEPALDYRRCSWTPQPTPQCSTEWVWVGM